MNPNQHNQRPGSRNQQLRSISASVRQGAEDERYLRLGMELNTKKRMAACLHQNPENGTPSINVKRTKLNQFTQKQAYQCNNCQDYIDVSKIEDADLDESKDTVLRGLQVIKMSLDISNAKDFEIYNEIRYVDEFLRCRFSETMAAVKKKTSNGKNKNRNNNGGGGSTFIKPSNV